MTMADLLAFLPILFKWFPVLRDLLEDILSPHDTPVKAEVMRILATPEIEEVSTLLARLKAKHLG